MALVLSTKRLYLARFILDRFAAKPDQPSGLFVLFELDKIRPYAMPYMRPAKPWRRRSKPAAENSGRSFRNTLSF